MVTNKFYCVDLYTETEEKWMNISSHKPNIIHGPYGDYLSFTLNKKEKNILIRRATHHHIKYHCVPKNWARNDNYRKAFFSYYKPPYKCRYCGKILKKEYMEIDHIIPMSKTKHKTIARILLKLQGINDVNDVRNLAPACKQCNRKKGDKMGLWIISGHLGKYPIFFAIKDVLKILVCIVCALILLLIGYSCLAGGIF